MAASMRATNNSIVRNYTRNINNSLNNLNKYAERAYTERRFTTMTENPAYGARALQLRQTMTELESNKDTAKTVLSTYKSAEDYMSMVAELGQGVYEKYVSAINGTNSGDELNALAAEITNLRDEILACANGRFAGNYIFGGSNVTSIPFEAGKGIDGKETLFYNGVDVRDIADEHGNVKPQYQYLFDDGFSVDIGLGLTQGKFDTTAYKASLNGLDFLGYGSENIYLLCNEILDAMADPNFTNKDPFDALIDRMQAAFNHVTLGVTDLGADTQYLEYTVERMENEYINLAERQDDIEFIDPIEALMMFKLQEYSYNAALQMGQRLIQPTLFSFIS